MKRKFYYSSFLVMLFTLHACTTTKFVPKGDYLLDAVTIKTDNEAVKPSSLQNYLRQIPNTKWFNFIKVPVYIYNMSGNDSTKWNNKLLRRLGDAPIIYSEQETKATQLELKKALHNRGYMGATVITDTLIRGKKLRLTYAIKSGKSYRLRSFRYSVADPTLRNYLLKDSVHSLIRTNMLFDANKLDAERNRITNYLQQQGYYKFNKEFIHFVADTVRNTYLVDLTLDILPYTKDAEATPTSHYQYKVRDVHFMTDYDLLRMPDGLRLAPNMYYKGFPFYYKDKLFLRPRLFVDNNFIKPNAFYNQRQLAKSYSSFARLRAVRYTNIRFQEVQDNDSTKLDCYVMLTEGKAKTLSAELEGTNSAGDLGAAVSLTYQHRNIFHGAETLTLKLRGAYESMSNLQNYEDNNYTEYGVEASLKFPRFLFPFLTSNFRRRIQATSEVILKYNAQFRPEYARTIASAAWSYKWNNQSKIKHQVDLIDLDYVYLPRISDRFKEKYLDVLTNSILRYNYENLLLIKSGYTYTYNSRGGYLSNNIMVPNSYSIRAHFESAGNVIYALSKLIHEQQNDEGKYSIINVAYAQYVKGDLSLTKNVAIDDRNTLVFHAGFGIAYPYGNSTILPFEKRYFAGGANSVRGWSVRTLGPGHYVGDDSNIDFMNQSGDLKIDFNIEYRTHLFWLLHGALFVDAGNIWTLRNYEEQPGGQFVASSFYRDFAVSYGMGFRFDFDFVVLRFDGGMKAINPIYSSGANRYPIFHPNFSRDFTLHFAVGYPF